MDIGDLVYFILLAIVGIVNFLNRRRKQQAEEKAARERPAAPENSPSANRESTRQNPTVERDSRNQEAQPAGDGKGRRGESRPWYEVESEEGDSGSYPNRRDQETAREDDPVRRILEELQRKRQEAEEASRQEQTGRPAPQQPKTGKKGQPSDKGKAKSDRRPRVPVAEGYREGEDFRDFAQRTRRQSRVKLAPVDELISNHSGKSKSGISVDLRQAVIYDAILRRPHS